MSRTINPELLANINSGVFDRRIFAIPGEEIRPETDTRPLGERVQPGDLITAEFINHILARLEALENRPGPTVPTTPTFPTFPTTFPTIFTIDPTIFTRPTLTATFPTNIFTQPTGPILTMVPTFTMGPTGLVLTMSPAFTMGPTGLATNPGNIATRDVGIATALGGIGGLATAPVSGGTIRREERVTVLPGIGREEETRLTNAGIRDIGGVADADPVILGNALGVQPAEAARMIGIARGALGPR